MSTASDMLSETGAAYLAGLLEGLQSHNKNSHKYTLRGELSQVIIGFLNRYGELQYTPKGPKHAQGGAHWTYTVDAEVRSKLNHYYQF